MVSLTHLGCLMFWSCVFKMPQLWWKNLLWGRSIGKHKGMELLLFSIITITISWHLGISMYWNMQHRVMQVLFQPCLDQPGFHPSAPSRLARFRSALGISSSCTTAALFQIPASAAKAAKVTVAHHPFHLPNQCTSCTQKHHFLCSRPFCIHGDAEFAGASLWSKSTRKLRPKHKDIFVGECLGRNETKSLVGIVAFDWTIVGNLRRDNLDIFCHSTFLCLANRELHLVSLGGAETLQEFFVQKYVFPIEAQKAPALVGIEGLDPSSELHGFPFDSKNSFFDAQNEIWKLDAKHGY